MIFKLLKKQLAQLSLGLDYMSEPGAWTLLERLNFEVALGMPVGDSDE